LLDKHLKQLQSHLDFLKKGQSAGIFSQHEVNKFAVIMNLLSATTTSAEQLSLQRIEFSNFINEYDRRKKKNFLQIFPELADIYFPSLSANSSNSNSNYRSFTLDQECLSSEESVLVLGASAIGIAAAQFLKRKFKDVKITDRKRDRIATALKSGLEGIYWEQMLTDPAFKSQFKLIIDATDERDDRSFASFAKEGYFRVMASGLKVE
jgi:hypothetical protein